MMMKVTIGALAVMRSIAIDLQIDSEATSCSTTGMSKLYDEFDKITLTYHTAPYWPYYFHYGD